MDKQFTPGQLVTHTYRGVVRQVKYVGPHHNPVYAWIIADGRKVTARWNELS